MAIWFGLASKKNLSGKHASLIENFVINKKIVSDRKWIFKAP